MGKVDAYGVDVAALKTELEDIERRKSRGTFWTPVVGKNVVRILPTWTTGKPFYLKVYGHWMRTQKMSVPCLNKMKGEKCFLCEKMEEIRATHDRKKAAGYAPGVRYLMQLVDRKDPEAGVQIFNTGASVFNSIIALLSDAEDWGPKILDLEKGHDIVIERIGEDLDTKYPSVRCRKDSSAAGVKKDALKNLEGIITWVTYAEMQALWEQGHNEAVALGTDGEVEEDPSPKATDEGSQSPKSGKKDCYKSYDPDKKECLDCEYGLDCEIDTPAK